MVELENIPEDAMADAFDVYYDNTPVRKGNARSKTRKRGKTKILSDYSYASRLDDGYSSQSPRGFTSPTIDFLRKHIKKLVGKI